MIKESFPNYDEQDSINDENSDKRNIEIVEKLQEILNYGFIFLLSTFWELLLMFRLYMLFQDFK